MEEWAPVIIYKMKFLLLAWLFIFPVNSFAQKIKVMKTDTTQEAEIRNTIEQYYFKGIYEGNTELLKQVFYQDTLLFGDIKGVPYYKTAI